MIKNNNILSYFRKDMSTLFIFSAAIALIAISPLVLSHFLLQPVQAQTTSMTFKTPIPAKNYNGSVTTTLTFDATGTFSTNSTSDAPDYQPMTGTFQITNSTNGQIVYSGDIERGDPPNANNAVLGMTNHANDVIFTTCSASNDNLISFNSSNFLGAVECDTGGGGGGGNTTAQVSSSSPSLTGSRQGTDSGNASSSDSNDSNSGGSSSNSKDGDRDGVPDSSDRCAHTSNPKCFNEGDTSNTTTTTAREQDQSSSSSSSSTSSSSSPPSSMTGTSTTSTQNSNNNNSRDSDGDGVPDSSDKCTHTSNPKCFKEGGDTSSTTTTTQQQEQPSSSDRTGNQTR